MEKHPQTISIRPFLLGLIFILLSGCSSPPQTQEVDILAALSNPGEKDCHARAETVVPFEFPRDAGPHPAFKTEWWYYTGNLTLEPEPNEPPRPPRHFGFQLTFFRQALACEKTSGPSQWRTRQLYFAHFALTDTKGNQFYSALRMNRGSLEIAGATPHRVWIDNWEARSIAPNHQTLRASHRGKTPQKDFHIQFNLGPPGQTILQGQRGLSPKGPGSASHYYSQTRIPTQGRIQIGPHIHQVKGLSWFDHEWSTSTLDKNVKGWDWFAGHLKDGQDLMVCQIRQADGRPNGFGFGSLVDKKGRVIILKEKDFELEVLDHWTSPATGKRYPSKWQIRIPAQNINFTATPVIPHQEHTQAFAYWEGALEFKDKKGLQGRGYGELTGY